MRMVSRDCHTNEEEETKMSFFSISFSFRSAPHCTRMNSTTLSFFPFLPWCNCHYMKDPKSPRTPSGSSLFFLRSFFRSLALCESSSTSASRDRWHGSTRRRLVAQQDIVISHQTDGLFWNKQHQSLQPSSHTQSRDEWCIQYDEGQSKLDSKYTTFFLPGGGGNS